MKPHEIDMKNWHWLPIDELVPYELNAKTHPDEQIRNLMQSLTDFGWTRPITVDADKVIIIGHGILLAAKALGLEEAPVVIRDDLDEKKVRELRNLDNKLSESPWDLDLLAEDLQDLDLLAYNLDWQLKLDDGADEAEHFWGNAEGESSEEYEAFEEKFKPKKTTDDCYTPENVYEAVLNWAVKQYGLKGREILRPFFPGGDYQHAVYPEGAVVIDNPPFSIISEICRFYNTKGIPFFLFAPHLTLFTIASGTCKYIPTGVSITYENGANVNTSFVTNLGDAKIEGFPDLYAAVKAADTENTASAVELPNYDYPDDVLTSSAVCKFVKYGAHFRVPETDAVFIRAMDEQRQEDKAIFGGGFLLSKEAAAEKAAAEKAAARKWTLTERELALQMTLGGDSKNRPAEGGADEEA